ncbi:MAG: hypothetical protein M3040_12740 [Bacteroidota bacterium]|nr:hypothetical protein [Bacteroidota bacterium]
MNKLILFFFLTWTNIIVGQVVNRQVLDRTPRKENYDSVISKAALAIDRGDFVKARELYQTALTLRPADPFAFKMIKRMDNNLKVLAASEVRDEYLRKRAEINTLLEQANDALTQKNLDTALTLYIHILSLDPAKSQEEFIVYRIKAIGQLLGSPTKNQLIENALTRRSGSNTTGSTAETSIVAAKKTYHDFSPDVFKKKVNKIKSQKTVTSIRSRIATNKTNSSKLKSATIPIQAEVALEKPTASVINKTTTETKTATTEKTKSPSPLLDKDVDTHSNIKGTPVTKEEKAYNLLMYQALKAINSKNYKEAKVLYQRMMNINVPNADKASIRVVIKSIDDVLARAQEKNRK